MYLPPTRIFVLFVHRGNVLLNPLCSRKGFIGTGDGTVHARPVFIGKLTPIP